MRNENQKFVSPLSCWDIYSEYLGKIFQKAKLDFDLRQLRIALKGRLDDATKQIIAKEHYDALVVTDADQNIEWVSRGFYEMTGYSKTFAIGKTPHFLQGPETTRKAKKSIGRKLEKGRIFKDSILNYRKNGKQYMCEIKVIPLFDEKNRLSHYLAIEKELRAA